MKKIVGYGILFGAILLAVTVFKYFQGTHVMYAQVNSARDLVNLFPNSASEITRRTQQVIDQANEAIRAIVSIAPEQRTKENTLLAFDYLNALSNLAIQSNCIATVEMVSKDESVRNAAREALIKIQEFAVDRISQNKELYKAIKEYEQNGALKDMLSEKEVYYLTEVLDQFKRAGLGLDEQKQAEVARLKKEIAAKSLEFDANIAADQTKVIVTRAELAGLPDDFIAQLKKDDAGNYILGMDTPTFTKVMELCSVSETRKKMYEARLNRAMPTNDALLKEIIALRDQLAHILGYESFAAYDVSDQMVKSPERVEHFLKDLIAKVKEKAAQEIKELTAQMPQGVTKNEAGKLMPWDGAYLRDQYKKKYLDIDETKIAEYFPLEQTIDGLFSVYEKFLSISFEKKPISGLWSDDLMLLELHPQGSKQVLGYIVLDLFPRDFKYSHACHITIVPSYYLPDGKEPIAVSVVIANFPRPSTDKPALLNRSDVNTFFHEFGHALHAQLGRTHIGSFSGTSVKTDFVEMPSQMLEEWLFDPCILKLVSSHYQTGESLPEDLIKKIQALKTFDSGIGTQTQLFYASLALKMFGPGAQKDPYAIMKQLYESIRTHLYFDPVDHMYASFGHLTGYGAKYYGYLWSKVFALDLFEEIRKHGLLDPEIGMKYRAEVIGEGGSVDPNTLLYNFLGREPNQKAFLESIGLNITK